MLMNGASTPSNTVESSARWAFECVLSSGKMEWHWTVYNVANQPVMRSVNKFASRAACFADAQKNGFPGTWADSLSRQHS